ncbi:hypothetical protein EB118_13745 [bacterium]|nr:hypothetical protein [bacterium]NDG31117.1 hypothetical protein [bacterium]
MKNIAVCLAGRIRGYENNLQSFQNFINELSKYGNIYFFVSLNTERDPYHIGFEEFLMKQAKCYFKYSNYVSPYHYPQFQTKYNMCSMFYNQQECFNMITQTSIPFDIVMKYRTEINYHGDLFKIQTPLEPNTVYVPNDYDYGGLNDQLGYFDMQTAWIYLSVYSKLQDYYDQSVYIHPETLLQTHLLRNNIKIVRFPFPYTLRR